MLKRREFGEKLVGAAIGASVANVLAVGNALALAARVPRTNTLMHVGGDYHSVAGSSITSRENLEYNLRYGVRHLTVQVRNRPEGNGWDPDALARMRDVCEGAEVKLEAIRMDPNYIILPKGPKQEK